MSLPSPVLRHPLSPDTSFRTTPHAAAVVATGSAYETSVFGAAHSTTGAGASFASCTSSTESRGASRTGALTKEGGADSAGVTSNLSGVCALNHVFSCISTGVSSTADGAHCPTAQLPPPNYPFLADADHHAWQRDAESRRGHRARGLVTSSQRLVTGTTVVLAHAGHDAWPLGLPMMEWQVKR